ncbi:MAG: hypothetical protein HZA54_15980, partial [Planctomycetes bacterium]|nr:hypothetical protein [Planctomycetota bacterium]
MAVEYAFEKSRKACDKCAREFAPLEEYLSTLHTVEETFARKSWCLGCWSPAGAAPDVFSFWRSRMPEAKAKKVDQRATLLSIFENRLRAETQEPMEVKLTYLLALILVQKRQFKLRETIRREDREYLDLLKTADDRQVLVAVASIAEAEIDQLKDQLGKLLEGG